MPDLNLQDTMPLGKYGPKRVGGAMTLEAVYKEDAPYLVWLRQERKNNSGDTTFFSREVSILLDMTIRESKVLQRKFKPWDLPVDDSVRTEPGPERREEPAMNYGGAWGLM